jgi:cell fate regulator YaaT (PSP1 superfamily)
MTAPVQCRVASVVDDWIRVLVDPSLPPVPCHAGKLDFGHGDSVVVETPDGRFVGRVTSFSPPSVKKPRTSGARVIRRATPADEKRHEDTGHLEREIEDYVRRRMRELDLDLHPFKVRLPLSGRVAVVYFSAEKRVDYRPLQRDLGRRFRRRIEMRSLGVRDGARLCGGLGPCGRCLCCTTFMDRFHSVTVRMAKRQNLSLNPIKISGLCGRLMCCLAHEVELYPERPRKRRSPS